MGCGESCEVLTDDGEHGERGVGRGPAPLTPALAWRSSRIPAELYPPASNPIVNQNDSGHKAIKSQGFGDRVPELFLVRPVLRYDGGRARGAPA